MKISSDWQQGKKSEFEEGKRMIHFSRFKELKFGNSTVWLKALREIEWQTASTPMDPKVRSLRTREQKKWLELRQLALVCHGISQRYGFTIDVAIDEAADYDGVARWREDGYENYTPFQLKEVVPSHLNKDQKLQDTINSLAKYTDSEDLAVAIHVNRYGSLDFSQITLPVSMKIAELWIYGSLQEDQSNWFLYGNVLSEPVLTRFSYP